MKAVNLKLCSALLLYSLLLPVSSANAQQVTLSASTGVSGQYVVVYGTGFLPNTSGFIFFDHNYDFQWNGGQDWKCGVGDSTDCEPRLNVTSDPYGSFSAGLFIPPGKRVSFLGAGTYFLSANLPIGGGADASAPFKVVGNLMETPPNPFPPRVPTLTGSNFVPYKLDGTQSVGRLWWDINGNYVFDPNNNETVRTVWVLPDGALSACPSTACKVINPFPGRGVGRIRVDIDHEADPNRSTQQKIEASLIINCLPLGPCS